MLGDFPLTTVVIIVYNSPFYFLKFDLKLNCNVSFYCILDFILLFLFFLFFNALHDFLVGH